MFWVRAMIVAVWQRTRPEFYQVIDPNAKCPHCGWRKGKLASKEIEVDEKRHEKRAVVEHTCSVCGGHWVDDPLGFLMQGAKPPKVKL